MVTATRSKGYAFSDLTRNAKRRALESLRDTANDYPDWHEAIFEDFQQIAGYIGLELGECRGAPAIYFSGFWCQGDGACFEGTWHVDRLKIPDLIEYAPEDKTLHEAVYPLWPIKRLFPNASAIIKHSGRYYHEKSVDIEVSVCDDEGNAIETDAAGIAETSVQEAMRSLMRWLYNTLEKEYENNRTDEAIIGMIEANDWRFNLNGTRYLGRG